MDVQSFQPWSLISGFSNPTCKLNYVYIYIYKYIKDDHNTLESTGCGDIPSTEWMCGVSIPISLSCYTSYVIHA